MKILVTGASGFIGSFVVEEALQKGMEVWAAVRKSSSRQWLQDARIRFIELDLGSQERLEQQLRPHQFDYVIHAAGVTKCLDRRDFFRINTEGTKNLVRALIALQMPLQRFVYLSSLSIYGAIREQQPYESIRETDAPCPNTAYGQSKLQAEAFLESVAASDGFPYVALRPTGVYGPREKDYFMMVQSIKRHLDLAVGFRQQDITFIYVRDVVRAVFLALDHGAVGRKYFLTDGQVYQSRTFSNLIHRELGRPWWIRLTAPLWLLRVATTVGEYVSRLTHKPTALNNDKYHILSQRNWRCDIEPAQRELGWQPEYNLERGVSEAVAWYKQNGWI